MENSTNRLCWLDNLRTFMIFLVVVIHAATVYEKYSMGADWWIVVDPSNSDLNGILFIILNIFVMAAMFFVSGYLTPKSIKNKRNIEFIWTKFKRLMIPWVIAVLTLIPLYKIIFLYSRNLQQEHWTTYFHWNSLWSQNWLWFLPVLFLFDILYLPLRKLKTVNISFKTSLWITLIVCFLYSFIMDYFDLHGWTKTILIDFQNERLLIYFVIFLLGAQLYKLDVFNGRTIKKKTNTIIHSLGWLPINLYIFFIIYELIYPNNFILNKAIHVVLTRIMFTLSLSYLLYSVITVFWLYLNITRKIIGVLNKASYGVYIIHVIIIGLISTFLLNTGFHHFIKFIIVVFGSYLISNTLILFYLKQIKDKIIKR